MPPAFVLSQNQTLKLMSDHRCPRGKTANLQGRLQGAVPAHHILLWICNETWNDLALPILRGLELLGDRGRRPHVPSSKPTMSKSRRISLPDEPGYRLAVERGANGVGQRPCPVGEAPYMEALAYRQWLFFRKVTALGQSPIRKRTRPEIRFRPQNPDGEATPRLQGPASTEVSKKTATCLVGIVAARGAYGGVGRPRQGRMSPPRHTCLNPPLTPLVYGPARAS